MKVADPRVHTAVDRRFRDGKDLTKPGYLYISRHKKPVQSTRIKDLGRVFLYGAKGIRTPDLLNVIYDDLCS
jgi:hypothetical protein